MKNLLIQFHTDVISPITDSNMSKYHESIWKERYYHKPDAFWELPKWVGELSYVLHANNVNHDFLVLRQPKKLRQGIKTVFGSVLESNKLLYYQLILKNPKTKFVLGGYINGFEFFHMLNNVVWVESIRDACMYMQIEYKYGTRWELFKDEWCIPRITMSYGCKHRCKFCTIDNEVIPVSHEDVYNQVTALVPLNFNLVYIDDKTFGQCDNYVDIKILGHIIQSFNQDFVGFIVQTTAGMVKKIDWQSLPVYACEVGVESYNDDILKELRKPANEKMITQAGNILNENGINFIPNIVVGFMQETRDTYLKTINYLLNASILHANIYNLAVYNDADIANDINVSTYNDGNEMVTEKSYNSDIKNAINKAAFDLIIECLIKK